MLENVDSLEEEVFEFLEEFTNTTMRLSSARSLSIADETSAEEEHPTQTTCTLECFEAWSMNLCLSPPGAAEAEASCFTQRQ